MRNRSSSTLCVETRWQGTTKIRHRAGDQTDYEHSHSMRNHSRSTLRVVASWQGTPKSKPRSGAHTDQEHTHDMRNQSRISKKFLYISQKKFGSAYAQSLRKCLNIKILAKIKVKEAKFISKIYEGHIRI